MRRNEDLVEEEAKSFLGSQNESDLKLSERERKYIYFN